MAEKRPSRTVEPDRTPILIGGLLLQWLTIGLFLLFASEQELVAGALVSQSTWLSIVQWLGGTISQASGSLMVSVPLGSLGLCAALLCLLINFSPGIVRRLSGTRSGPGDKLCHQLSNIVQANCFWSLPIGIWCLLWIVNFLLPGMVLSLWLVRAVPMTVALSLAGWLWEALRVLLPSKQPEADPGSRIPRHSWIVLCAVMAGYLLVFVPMNFGLWFNLQIPHGDSSMYEEHLWNTLHGKGFRSYLDQGLFLGEHIQVIHLLLLPLYALWPSHLLLEFCGSAAIAVSAIPVFLLTRRSTESNVAALFVAAAFLCSFPVQYLDIAVDLKTFRPSAFGIPIMLFGLLAAERKQWIWMSFCFLLALASQEDFAIVIAPFGLWLAIRGWREQKSDSTSGGNRRIALGLTIAVLATVYVFSVVKILIPWFRSGVPVHYVSYFEAFGKTPLEIVTNLLFRPDLVWRELVTAATLALFLDLLIPFGAPFRAWSRLLVGVPLFILLAANQLTRDYPGPFHHFHAPILPILGWAACAAVGLGNISTSERERIVRERGLWVLCCALTTGLFFSVSPLGIKFWDSGSAFYWKRLYVPDERAKEFAKVLPLIPTDARVASTDFVHPRFTHFERSYDYSQYARRVADWEDKVPDDTEYIVIDTRHRYSEIQRFDQTREYRNQRDQWEEVPVETAGYFIVLKRVKFPEPAEQHH